MRRDPATILAAHKMDAARSDLYVEGVRDKIFLEWLFALDRAANAQIITVDFVDVPHVHEGGNRERLLSFLREVEHEDVDIRGFVDADHHRLSSAEEVIPANCWLTDFRDIESYVLTDENVDAVLRSGCGLAKPTVEVVLPEAAKTALFMAAIRFHSHEVGLRLPVAKSNWIRHVACRPDGTVEVNRGNVMRSLLQGGKISLARLTSIETAVSQAEESLRQLRLQEVLHGKDFSLVFTKQLAALGVKIDSASRLMFSTFKRESIAQFPNLAAVGRFLTGT